MEAHTLLLLVLFNQLPANCMQNFLSRFVLPTPFRERSLTALDNVSRFHGSVRNWIFSLRHGSECCRIDCWKGNRWSWRRWLHNWWLLNRCSLCQVTSTNYISQHVAVYLRNRYHAWTTSRRCLDTACHLAMVLLHQSSHRCCHSPVSGLVLPSAKGKPPQHFCTENGKPGSGWSFAVRTSYDYDASCSSMGRIAVCLE